MDQRLLFSGQAIDLSVVLWPMLLFGLGGGAASPVSADMWLFFAEISGALVALSLCMIVAGIWRRGIMELRTSKLFFYLSAFAIFGWVISAAFDLAVTAWTAVDCGSPTLWKCAYIYAQSYSRYYVVPSLAVSIFILIFAAWNLASFDHL